MKKVTYQRDITVGVSAKDLESLDNYATTREIVSFAALPYLAGTKIVGISLLL